MHQTFQCLQNLKMKQQTTIFGCFIISMVLLTIMGACLVQSTILLNMVQNSSQRITAKEEKRSISQASIRIKDYLRRKHIQCIIRLMIAVQNVFHIQKFFEQAVNIQENVYNMSDQLLVPCRKEKKQESTEPTPTPEPDKVNDRRKESKIKYDTNLLCYQSLSNQDGTTLPQNNSQVEYFKFTASLLSQYSLLLDISRETQLFIFDLPETQMMISYPQNIQPKNYSIKARPWFQFYMNQLQNNPDQQIYSSRAYLSAITNTLNMAVVATIPDKNGDPMGFTAQTLLLTDQNIAAIPLNIFLVDDDGQILFTNIDTIIDATEQLYLYNTRYTGFNETDWNLILQYLDHVNLSSYTCNGYHNTFCLYNKYFNSTVQVDAMDFEVENLKLIVFVNVTYQSDLAQQFIQLTDNLRFQILQIVITAVIVSLIMLSFTAVFIEKLFRPLYHLMNHVKLNIKMLGNNIDRQILSMARRLDQRVNIFSQLTLKFLTWQDILGKSQVTKSKLCLQIEKFTFNRTPKHVEIGNIKSEFINLKDQEYSDLDQATFQEIFQLTMIQQQFF